VAANVAVVRMQYVHPDLAALIATESTSEPSSVHLHHGLESLLQGPGGHRSASANFLNPEADAFMVEAGDTGICTFV
jgi:hypothetical protein